MRAAPASPGAADVVGLTAAEVAQRVAAGRANAVDLPTSRTVTAVLRANIITPFNGLLVVLFLATIATGRWQNALFGGVIVANSAIGIVQELRAKRTLDRLAVLNTPHARVIRDGVSGEVDLTAVVADDVLDLRTGDQVPTDGLMLHGDGLEIDESLLTGESEPVPKSAGDGVRSGSIVVAGAGLVRATAVGADAYATQIAMQARRFALTHSELVAGTNRLLRWISLSMLAIGPLVLWSQFASSDNRTWQESVTGAVAALVGMVPEGLVLLTSVAFVVATVTLSRHSTLVQELPAVEALARVDVVCLDKTGTITHGDVVLDEVRPLSASGDSTPESDVAAALGLLGQAPAPNATTTAIAAAHPRTPWTAVSRVAFSSARKWSAVTSDGHGTWFLGAPELMLPTGPGGEPGAARREADEQAAQGRRVLLLARGSAPTGTNLPPDLLPAALVLVSERIRDDARDTIRFFAEEGVAIRVISGDNPRTVGAVAAAVGVPGVLAADDAIDARTLPDDPDRLADALDRHAAFGRVTPQQKRAMVQALQRRGHVVAMTGDGVNDALALKDADIGVAMGSGSAASRAVAQIVLLDGRFAHLPHVVAEGRRVIANIERAASLFLVKNVYSLVLALVSAGTLAAYPMAPIQLTLISTLAIGIPGFVLALGPNRRRYVPGFLRRALRFAVPVGVTIAACAYAAYRVTRSTDSAAGVAGGRTAAALAVLIVSLWTLLVLARPLAGWKLGLVAGLAGIAAVVVAIPVFGHGVFLLDLTGWRLAVGAMSGALGAALVELSARWVAPRPAAD